MFKSIALIAATLAVAVSGPAFAGEKLAAKVVEKNGQTFYCVKQAVTGSFIPVRTCLTQTDLEAQGAKIASIENAARLALNTTPNSAKN